MVTLNQYSLGVCSVPLRLFAVLIVLWMSPAYMALADGGTKKPVAGYSNDGILWEVSFKKQAIYPEGGLTIPLPEPDEDGALSRGISLSTDDPGASARRGNTLYVITKGVDESVNTLFIQGITGRLNEHVTLDRSDSVRALFFKGRNLFAIFYNSDMGSAALYSINPVTGVSTLVLDLTEFGIEPLHGALTTVDGFYYLLAKSISDADRRILLKFRLSAGSASALNISDQHGDAVQCEKIRANPAKKNFVCLAPNVEKTRVNVCRVTSNGIATCGRALRGAARLELGPSLMSEDGKSYWAIVRTRNDTGESNTFLNFSADGKVLLKDTIPYGLLLANFAKDTSLSK